MVDKKQVETSKIDALYSWLSYDLQKIKAELLKEMKYASVQTGSLYQAIKSDREQSSRAVSQEIRYGYKQSQTIYDDLSTQVENAAKEIVEKLDGATASVADTVAEKLQEIVPSLQSAVNEVKYGYVQQQAIYEGLTTLIEGEVVAKLDDMQAKLAMLEQIDATLTALEEKVAQGIATYEENDYKSVIESVAEKTEESVALHSKQVLDAVAAIPVAENVDYNRIVDEVGDKVLEYLGEIVPQNDSLKVEVDYDKIAYGTAEKVVESLPYPEKVDYRRIDALFMKAVETVQAQVSEEVIEKAVSTAVEKVLGAFDVDALAAKVAEKIAVPVATVEVPEIDYERLADMVAEKLSVNTDQTYDVVLDETGISQIAEKVAEKLNVVENTDYERIANIVEEKVNAQCDEPTYELTVDEEGVKTIAKSISDELCARCKSCEPAPAPVEETVEVVEEPAVEEVVEEVVEVVEEPAVEELAVAVAESNEPKHVDAAAGLVDRLNRSFVAKMKQSEEKIKGFYSDLKNALISYKKINSNVSWNGDRFNFGRDTVAKMLIRGKTLRLLLALDPENPEFKETVYHQKNVGDQKAHESTPFMVKISSEMGVKKALRLVTALAEKLQAEKDVAFEAVDYVAEYAYEDDEALEMAGQIKRTKEKKVDFNF